MKVKFVKQHIVRGQTRAEDVVYEKDQVVDFKGPVDETYARAYINRGHAVEYDPAADRAQKKAEEEAARAAAKLEARAKIAIPEDLSKTSDADVMKLGQSVSDEPASIKTKDDALKAITAEQVRRNPT